MVDEGSLHGLEEEIKKQIEAAVQFALDAPYPDVSEVDKHVYA